MEITNLETLKIHKMSKKQYERELAAGRIDENALYLTPDESLGESIIVDVTELPENANGGVFYRLFTATFIHNRHVVDNSVCYIVDKLPEIGEPATNSSRNSIVAYYNLSDKKVYGYLDEVLATSFGTYAEHAVDIGWYEASLLFPLAGWSYAGVIDNIGEDPNDSTIRLLLDTKIYVYHDKWIELTNSIIDEKLPAPDEDIGHWAYTVQRYEDGKEKAELYLISHSINELEKNKYQIPLRENGIIKVKEPKEDLDAANKKYVDEEVAKISVSEVSKAYVDAAVGAKTPSEGLTFKSNGDGTCSVTGIGICTDTRLVIPFINNGEKVTAISTEAFHSCESITSIVIPDSVTSIKDGAFAVCSNLTDVTLPKNLANISMAAFAGTNIESIVIPDGVTKIEDMTFAMCQNLKSVVIPESVTILQSDAFVECSSNLTLYCKAKSKPSGWSNSWNQYNYSVVWGFENTALDVYEKAATKDYVDKNMVTSDKFGDLTYKVNMMNSAMGSLGSRGGVSVSSMPGTTVYLDGIPGGKCYFVVIHMTRANGRNIITTSPLYLPVITGESGSIQDFSTEILTSPTKSDTSDVLQSYVHINGSCYSGGVYYDNWELNFTLNNTSVNDITSVAYTIL